VLTYKMAIALRPQICDVTSPYVLNAVRCPYTYVRNAGRGQLSSEWRHNENDVIIRMGLCVHCVCCCYPAIR